MGYQSDTRLDGFCIMKLGIELIVIDLLWHMTCVMYPMTYCIRYMGIEKSTMQQVLLMLKKVEFYAFRKKKKKNSILCSWSFIERETERELIPLVTR